MLLIPTCASEAIPSMRRSVLQCLVIDLSCRCTTPENYIGIPYVFYQIGPDDPTLLY